MNKSILAVAILALVGCKAPVDVVTPDTFVYDVRYTDYFLGTGVDFGVEFETEFYDCIAGFTYDILDLSVSLGTCDADIYTRIVATKE